VSTAEPSTVFVVAALFADELAFGVGAGAAVVVESDEVDEPVEPEPVAAPVPVEPVDVEAAGAAVTCSPTP
jgi:hypothetical protein